MWEKILWLAAGGAAGSLARYGLSGLVQKLAGGVFPWGTLAVNVTGCLAFGLLWSLSEQRLPLSPIARVAVLTGFLGALTTFSTFAFETGQLLRGAQWAGALANVGLHNLAGLAALFAGFALGRTL